VWPTLKDNVTDTYEVYGLRACPRDAVACCAYTHIYEVGCWAYFAAAKYCDIVIQLAE
jgi:hypothetical protein